MTATGSCLAGADVRAAKASRGTRRFELLLLSSLQMCTDVSTCCLATLEGRILRQGGEGDRTGDEERRSNLGHVDLLVSRTGVEDATRLILAADGACPAAMLPWLLLLPLHVVHAPRPLLLVASVA